MVPNVDLVRYRHGDKICHSQHPPAKALFNQANSLIGANTQPFFDLLVEVM
jgi:hypothetical protein